MEQRESIPDLAQRKLARQLDFTAITRGSANLEALEPVGSKKELELLPQTPQSLSQSILRPKSQSPSRIQIQQQLQSQAYPCSPLHLKFQGQQPWSRSPAQHQRPSQSQVTPQLQVRAQLVSPVRRIPHPVQKYPVQTLPITKQESPRSQPQYNVESREITPLKKKQCNCKNSRCLKLYCECFAAGIYCDGCNCTNCHNNVDNEAAREEAVGITLERNPNAFKPKIASSPRGPRDSKDPVAEIQVLGKHNKGCHCKKSGCLKKYCECYQANIFCSENCKCMGCKNFEGSEERRAVSHEEYNSINVKQAANAAISEAIGSFGNVTHITPKRRRIQEIFSGKAARDPPVNLTACQQESDPIASITSLPVSLVFDTANLAMSGSSRSAYRSPLAGVLQPQDVKYLCSLLVVMSGAAGKTVADQRGEIDQQIETANSEASIASSDHLLKNAKEEAQRPLYNGHLNNDETTRAGTSDSGSDGIDTHNYSRPASPETLALMCDEQDEVFLANGSANGGACNGQNMILKSSNSDGCTDVYGEQERLVLTRFWDVLRGLITRGSIKETMCSELAKEETGSKQEPAENGNGGAETGEGSGEGIHSNCIAKSLIPTASEVFQTKKHVAATNGHGHSDLSIRVGPPAGNPVGDKI